LLNLNHLAVDRGSKTNL